MKDWTNSKILLWTYCIVKECTIPMVLSLAGWILVIEMMWMIK